MRVQQALKAIKKRGVPCHWALRAWFEASRPLWCHRALQIRPVKISANTTCQYIGKNRLHPPHSGRLSHHRTCAKYTFRGVFASKMFADIRLKAFHSGRYTYTRPFPRHHSCNQLQSIYDGAFFFVLDNVYSDGAYQQVWMLRGFQPSKFRSRLSPRRTRFILGRFKVVQ